MYWTAGFASLDGSRTSAWQPAKLTPAQGVDQVWKSSELRIRQATHENLKATLIGDCFATDQQLETAVRRAFQGDIREITLLPGSFLSVIDHGSSRTVLGDISGNVIVYYTTDESGNCWWSTAATPLATLIGAQVSYEQLLLELTAYGILRYGGSTPFPGVEVLKPGFTLEFTPNSQSATQWHIPSSSHSLQEGAGLFRKALVESVKTRSNPQHVLAADFSGGLDSTTLAVLAAQDTTLAGITYCDPWMASDDLEYAKTVAQMVPNLTHRVVQGGETTVHYAGLDAQALPMTDLPSMDAVMLGYNSAKLMAADTGTELYLNGMAGDCVLHSPITRVADQYVDGQKLEALKAAATEARRMTVSPTGMMQATRKLAKTPYSGALRELSRKVLDADACAKTTVWQPSHSMTWCRLTPAATWLTPQGQESTSQLLLALSHTTDEPKRPGDFHTWLGLWQTTAMRQTTNAYAHSLGIRPQPVFTDTAVVMAAFGVPTYERATRTAFKPLLKAAFGDVLPSALTSRLTKGDFGGMMLQGIKRNEPVLHQIIQESRIADAGLVDRQAAQADLRRAALGLRAPHASLQGLIVAELWLSQLDLRKETWWIPQ